MSSVDIERVKRVLADATKDPEKLSRRGLSLAAGQSRDCVGDIINGRNKNPTINVLMSLAEQLGGDLSLFGLSIDLANEPPTVSELEAALLDTLPDMPRGAPDKRARFLAEGVAQILRLPQSRPAIGQPDRPTAPAKDAPLHEATKSA